MADAGAIKNMNMDAVRRVLYQRGNLSKRELAYETGLSFPTVSRTVEMLIHTGELLEKGLDNSTGGRCAKVYSINPLYSVSLAMRIEGRELSWFVSNLTGEKVDFGAEQCETELLQTMDRLIESVQMRYPQLGAIVIGVAGIVHHGTVIVLSDCEELWGVNLPMHFHDKFKLPAEVTNDMKAAAAGYWSRHQDQPSVATVCIYLGKNGIGSGIVINGKVWHGASEFAGEVLYLPILENNKEHVNNGFSEINMVDYYGKIIQSYAALLNPDRIVLYDNPYIRGRIDDIRRFCAKNLPTNSIPQIEISHEFIQDYEHGLTTISLELLADFSANSRSSKPAR